MKYARTMNHEHKKQSNFLRRLLLPGLIGLLSLLVGADTGQAQISIDGVSDKQVYADSVSFTVHSEAGYDYTVELNGQPKATDVAIEVTEPEYYELYVYRREQNSGAEESELVQFIVRASERGNTEWGLPVWTPYPSIASAASEFAGAQLQIVMPATYPQGLEIPVIARVENASGNRIGVNGTVRAMEFETQPIQLRRGVGYVFLPAATEAGSLSYTAEIQTLQTPKQITIESTTWQTVSSDITTSANWGEDARIHISGVGGDLLTIASGVTLTIGAGSVILIDPDIEIAVAGAILVNGTNERPIVFTCPDRNIPWGGFLFESSQSAGEFHGTIFTASGADSNWFNNNPGHGTSHRKNQCLFYLSNGAHVTLTDSYAVENHGQLGHGESSYLSMTGCLVQKCVTAGQYNGGAVIVNDCALLGFPSATASFVDADNDVFYLTGGAHSLTDSLMGWCLDDAIDAGDGAAGSVTVTRCWFESIYHEAMAWSSGPRDADVRDSVVLNCGQGIECGYDDPDVDADHCLCTTNVIGARFGDNYDWSYDGFLKVSNSLLLFNVRDVWGRAWDDWSVHLSQMDIQDNTLSVPNANYPNNGIWDPVGDPNQRDELAAFLPTPADTVGLGLAVLKDTFTLAELSTKIPVRLSTFTTQFVSVDYTIYTERGLYDNGTLDFIPGQTIEHIEFITPPLEGLREVRILLSNPIHAELTGYQQLIFSKPYEIVEPLIREGDDWHYFKGSQEPRPDWNQLGFIPDPNWLVGPTGIGYETSTGYGACLATKLTDMRNNYISVYARREFFVADPSRLKRLTFTMDWDDGYIAYLNGIPVDSQYPPSPALHDQPATTDDHEACCGTSTPTGPCPPEQVDLSAYRDDLVVGYNVLAIQVHNRSISSSDFLFIPELYGAVTPWPGDFEPDGDVDFDDYVILASAWLTEYGQLRYNPLCDISVRPDGLIDLRDLVVFFDNWLAGY